MAIPDRYSTCIVGLESPAVNGADVTPHDTNDLPFMPRNITCLVAGTIRVQWPSGAVSNHTIAVGVGLPYRVQKIHATGTSATGIAIAE